MGPDDSRDTLYVGLDAGGSKTELYAAPARGASAVRTIGPGAQLQRIGAAAAARILAETTRSALAGLREHGPVVLCAGVAGAGRSEDREALETALVEALGPAVDRILVTDDADIALEGAFEEGTGLLVIAGTGSIVVGRRGGERLRAGGWGALLGDEGSGYRLGQRALRAVADRFDGGADTLLTELAAEKAGIHDASTLIRRVYAERWPLQEAAPLLLEAAASGDGVALALLAEETEALARQAGLLARGRDGLERRVALAGGLGGVPVYREAFTAALARHLPDWRLEAPRHTPVVGAWRLAQRAPGGRAHPEDA